MRCASPTIQIRPDRGDVHQRRRAGSQRRPSHTGREFTVNSTGGVLGQPFGGYKLSGIGREMGLEGYLEWSQTKSMKISSEGQLPRRLTTSRVTDRASRRRTFQFVHRVSTSADRRADVERDLGGARNLQGIDLSWLAVPDVNGMTSSAAGSRPPRTPVAQLGRRLGRARAAYRYPTGPKLGHVVEDKRRGRAADE